MTSTRPYVVGIIGGGQLARMTHAASVGLGIQTRLLSEMPDSSAAQVISDVAVGDHNDPDVVSRFAAGCDVITFDHEHVPPEILSGLESRGIAVRPGPDALIHAQDKAIMRRRLTEFGAPCPRHQVVADVDELKTFAQNAGWPLIVKTSRGGYDGKGVFKLDDVGQADDLFVRMSDAANGAQLLAEEYIDFRRELSALVARAPNGQAVTYPISETVQRNGICTQTITPAPELSDEQAIEYQQLALSIAAELGVTGMLAVELMQRPAGDVVVNELAMRPHNTGHWSIDNAHTSQFENHLRAVLDLPLGSPQVRDRWAVMTNVLGGSVTDLPAALLHCFARDRALRVQLYGKQVKPGRKVGHVTTFGDDLDQVRRRSEHAANYLMGKI
jgi:5-(carboxyamino)imidazole ribonucleotide synthase